MEDKSMIISVRLRKRYDKDLIQYLSSLDHQTRSDVVRKALRCYVEPSASKQVDYMQDDEVTENAEATIDDLISKFM